MPGVIVGAVTALLVAAIGLLGRSKIEEIHVLVNSRLSEALSEIQSLKTELKTAKDDSNEAT